MLGMGRSPVSPVAKWIEKMASETVETKLPRLCHARLLQLSEQTVDDDQITNCPRSADRFYGIDVSRFPFPVSRFPFSVSEQSVCPWIRWTIFEERGTRWLTSRVRSSVTLSSTVFTRR